MQVYFVLDKDYFSNTNPLIYKSKNGQFIKDNFQRYSMLPNFLLESFKKLFWYPDIIITNDWQNIYVTIYFERKNFPKMKNIINQNYQFHSFIG